VFLLAIKNCFEGRFLKCIYQQVGKKILSEMTTSTTSLTNPQIPKIIGLLQWRPFFLLMTFGIWWKMVFKNQQMQQHTMPCPKKKGICWRTIGRMMQNPSSKFLNQFMKVFSKGFQEQRSWSKHGTPARQPIRAWKKSWQQNYKCW